MRKIIGMFPQKVRAQAIAEVAVFGAIILFLIASIVHQTVSTSFVQEHSLKTFRKAMALSAQEGRGVSLLIIDDRLTPSVSKYGATERQPVIASSGGTFTQNLFMPMTCGNQKVVPVMNVIINGVDIKNIIGRNLTTAAWVTKSCSVFKTKTAKTGGCCSGVAWTEEVKSASDVSSEVDEESGSSASYDIDNDGSDEAITRIKGGSCCVLDPNEGDIDTANPKHGLSAKMDFTANVSADFIVDNAKQTATRRKSQKNTICRYFVTKGGEIPICINR